MNASGSNVLASAAIRVRKGDASNRVTSLTGDR